MGETSYAARGAAVACTLVLVAGCSGATAGGLQPVGALSARATTTSLYAADGMRVADSGRAVVVAYTGGSCDRDARAEAVESATQVTVTVRVDVPVGACDAVGHPRDVTAHLAAPVGSRALVDGATGARVTPYDGPVLQPAWLPAGFSLLHEGPSIAGGPSSESWRRVYGESAAEASTTCVPGRFSLSVTLSTPAAADDALRGFRPVPGVHRVGGVTAELGVAPETGEQALRWSPPALGTGLVVAVRARGDCDDSAAGSPTVDPALLQRFAEGLR